MSTFEPMKSVAKIFFLLFVQIAFSQQQLQTQYVSSNWDMEDGLPQSSINSIIQTNDGYIWLGTFGGLVRFDGVAFTVFDRSNSKGMLNDRILQIYYSPKGTMWLSTEGGFVRYEKNIFTTFTIKDGDGIYSPLTAAEDTRGVLWISANGKPYRFQNEQFILKEVIENPILAQQAVQDSAGVWLFHNKELLRTLGDSVVRVLDLSSILGSSIKSFVEYPKHSGQYWFATDENGVVLYDQGKIKERLILAGPQRVMDSTRVLFINCMSIKHVHCGLQVIMGLQFLPGHRFKKLRL